MHISVVARHKGHGRMSNCVQYRGYAGLADLDLIGNLIRMTLSEPYSIWTYHYFLQDFPYLCHTAWSDGLLVGVVMGRIGPHNASRRAYIGMLAVDRSHRGRGIGLALVRRVVDTMIREGVDEIVLEAEVDNQAALNLYSKLGFIREKRLPNYYMNGSDAYRLKLWTC